MKGITNCHILHQEDSWQTHIFKRPLLPTVQLHTIRLKPRNIYMHVSLVHFLFCKINQTRSESFRSKCDQVRTFQKLAGNKVDWKICIKWIKNWPLRHELFYCKSNSRNNILRLRLRKERYIKNCRSLVLMGKLILSAITTIRVCQQPYNQFFAYLVRF